MSDRRSHRGPAPGDEEVFSEAACARMREASSHLVWLWDQGYAERAALQLVGNRFALTERQRTALRRAVCSSAARASRLARRLEPPVRAGATDQPGAGRRRQRPSAATTLIELHVDGFNLLTTIEAALSGAVILHCHDGCFRDLAGVHGSYRRVTETLPAIGLVHRFLSDLGCRRCHWYLDRPVSNSGRLRSMIESVSRAEPADCGEWIEAAVHVVPNPDAILVEAEGPIATADSAVLDRCGPWINLARLVIESAVPEAWRVRLSADAAD